VLVGHSNSAIGHSTRLARRDHSTARCASSSSAFDIGTGHRGGGARTAQRDQFVGQQVFQALAAGSEEFQGDLIGLLRSSRQAPERHQRLASNWANASALACT
jgi:hypothetical protein